MDTNEYTFEVSAGGLAGRIHAYRMDNGITQRQLADQLGVTQQSVARWEQGSPPRTYMLRILESLLEGTTDTDSPADLAEIIGIRAPAKSVPPPNVEGGRKMYIQGCLKLLERGERLPNRVLLLLADELGWGDADS